MKKWILAAFLLLTATIAYGGSSPNVPIDDPVYRDIDRLVAPIEDALKRVREK